MQPEDNLTPLLPTNAQQRSNLTSSHHLNDISTNRQKITVSSGAVEQNYYAQLMPSVTSDAALLRLNSPLIPPVSWETAVSTEHVEGFQNLGFDIDVMGVTAKYLLNNALPLCLSRAKKRNILKDTYVDFDALLPNFNFNEDVDNDILCRNPKIKIAT